MPTFVKSVSKVQNAQNTVLNFPINIAGDMIVIVGTNPNATAIINNITDTLGTTYKKQVNDSLSQTILWAGQAKNAGNNTITINWANIGPNAVIVAEYGEVSGIGTSGSTTGNFTSGSLVLNVANNGSWTVGGLSTQFAASNFNPAFGILRAVTGSTYLGSPFSILLLDSPGIALSSTWTGTDIWSELGIELIPSKLVVQLPSAIFQAPARPQNKTYSDKIYPYAEIQVIPTTLSPIPFICKRCGAPSSATIYRDIRDYSISMGNTSKNFGGLNRGERFDFINCGSCGTWYRKNDYKIIPNIRISDVGINPNLDPLGDISTAFADQPLYPSSQANISDDNIRTAIDLNLFVFTDQFEPTGFTITGTPTIYSFGDFDSSTFSQDDFKPRRSIIY